MEYSVTMEECKAVAYIHGSLKDCCINHNFNDYAGCVNHPLLNIELCFVITDELHLLLRISDKIISNFVLQMAAQDQASRVHHQAPATSA